MTKQLLADAPHLESYAGLLNLDNMGSKQYFFNYIVGLEDTSHTVIWLNGGPGCSSLDGLFIEVGPYKFKEHKLVYNEYGWHTKANIIFGIKVLSFCYFDSSSWSASPSGI